MTNERTTLTPEEMARYHRHRILPEIGVEGQLRLKNSRALVVGAGGLGSAAALYLAAAGVGTLGIVDADQVDLSNLQRQILHGEASLGAWKTDSARDRLAVLNSQTDVLPHREQLSLENARHLIIDYDIVLGCVDNLTARYAINQACVELGIANIYGSAEGLEGQASVFSLDGGPCYRCFFREPPEVNPEAPPPGVLATVPGIIGCIQAHEALKSILGIGQSLSGRLLLLDAAAMRFREIPLKRDPKCPACGKEME